jgi:inositol-phosphate phosphatase / L-galactose 1-phosphate phosphatase / histidinol-phosphatase
MDNPRLSFALAAARAGGAILRQHYRKPLDITHKEDASPVSKADIESETHIRNLITNAFPDDGILGEELESTRLDAQYVWVIDPLDGTASFLTGRPLFGVLLALLKDGKPILGVIYQPITNECWLGAAKMPTTYNGSPICTSSETTLKKVAVATTGSHYFTPKQREAFEKVAAFSRFPIYGGDCYLYGQLALGHVGAVIEANLAAHDLAALIPIVQGAGGVITTWEGELLNPLSTEKQTVLAAANADLHQQCLVILNG